MNENGLGAHAEDESEHREPCEGGVGVERGVDSQCYKEDVLDWVFSGVGVGGCTRE